jgi:hypothetical protein
MQKTLALFFIACVGYTAYLVKNKSDIISHQQQEISTLTQQLESERNAAPKNGTLAQQATCSAQADMEHRKLLSGPRDGGSKVVVATAVGHYNATLNRCLIRTQLTTEDPDSHTMWFVSVKDGFDGKEFASEITERAHLRDEAKTNHTLTCFYQASEGEQNCAENPGTFDAGVAKLMEGASKW